MADQYLKRYNHYSPTSSRKLTVSLWFKGSYIPNVQEDFFTASGSSGTYRCRRYLGGALTLEKSGTGGLATTTDVFRDPTQFYHFVWSIDTTQANANDRIRIYVNGVAVSNSVTIAQNTDLPFGDTDGQLFISQNSADQYHASGAMSEFYYVDGQQLAASAFGKTHPTTGQWVPKHPDGVIAALGNLGNNGFHMPMNDYDDQDYFVGGQQFDEEGASVTVVGTPNWTGDTPRGLTGSSVATGGGYIGVPASTFDFTGNSWTVECWHKPYGEVSNYQAILSNTTSSALSYAFYGNGGTSNTFSPRFYMDKPWSIDVQPNTQVTSLYRWTHLAYVLDNGIARLYVNGVQQGSATGTYNGGAVSSSTSYIGFSTFNNVAHGAGGLDAYTYGLRVTRGQALYPNGTTFTPGNTSGTTYTTDGTNYSAITGTVDFRQKTNVIMPGSATTGMGMRQHNFTNKELTKDTISNTFPSFNDVGTDQGLTASVRSGGYLNITQSSAVTDNVCIPSMGIPKTGKWYFEVKWFGSSVYYGEFGLGNLDKFNFYQTGYGNSWLGAAGDGNAIWYWPWDNGSSQQYQGLWTHGWNTGSNSADYVQNDFGTTIDSADPTFMWAIDRDNGKVYFGYNGTWQVGDPSAGTGGITLPNNDDNWTPIASFWNSTGNAEMFFNFGQDPTCYGSHGGVTYADANGNARFKHQPPTGYLGICTKNLDTLSIDPEEHFKVVEFTGTGATQSINVGFQPDLIWFSNRTNQRTHPTYNSVLGRRGMGSNETVSYLADAGRDLVSYDANGFTVGPTQYLSATNASGDQLIARCWKAGGAAVTNNDGSVTSYVSANTAAGFSIVKHANTNGTVGHGLNQKPELVITKVPDNYNWWTFFDGWDGTLDYIALNATDTQIDATQYTGSNVFTNTTIPSDSAFNGGGGNLDVYAFCWHSVPGYSKIGTYEGNDSDYGPFIQCGFRPAFVLIKCISGAAGQEWCQYDNTRSPSNPANKYFYVNTAHAEATGRDIDFYANGFKPSLGASGATNASGRIYIYMAFAESPFKSSNSR